MTHTQIDDGGFCQTRDRASIVLTQDTDSGGWDELYLQIAESGAVSLEVRWCCYGGDAPPSEVYSGRVRRYAILSAEDGQCEANIGRLLDDLKYDHCLGYLVRRIVIGHSTKIRGGILWVG